MINKNREVEGGGFTHGKSFIMTNNSNVYIQI